MLVISGRVAKRASSRLVTDGASSASPAMTTRNAEIRNELYLSEPTVKTHVGRILMKLGVRDRVQLVVLAYERGLVEPGRG
jgi:ATP/maltotriose-dependent transcriptional regulator MalT